jgi:hypothetical protein
VGRNTVPAILEKFSASLIQSVESLALPFSLVSSWTVMADFVCGRYSLKLVLQLNFNDKKLHMMLPIS